MPEPSTACLGNKGVSALSSLLGALLLCVFAAADAAAKGPVTVTISVESGDWKAVKLRNLPKAAVVALQVDADRPIQIALADSAGYQRYPGGTTALFSGQVDNRLSFSVTIPQTGHYYVILDNRNGTGSRTVTVTMRAARGPADQIKAADSILRLFEKQLHQLFIFAPFAIGIDQCEGVAAFADDAGILLCTGYIQGLYKTIQDKDLAKGALSFSIFHEVARELLGQWRHPRQDEVAAADELAVVLLRMVNQAAMITETARALSQRPALGREMEKVFGKGRHPLGPDRAARVLDWLEKPGLVHAWQPFIIPHMQPSLLERLRLSPTDWADIPLIEKELALRKKTAV